MKRKYSVFHNNSDIKNALLLFGQGWTTKRIAKKMKVTETTIYNWRNKFPKYAVRKVTSLTSKNGLVTTIKPVVTKSTGTHELTVTLDNKTHAALVKLAHQEIRTVSDQAKYLVLTELHRIARNNQNIPF